MSETCCCNGGAGVGTVSMDKLQAVLDKYKETKGAIIPILQEAQEAYGYLSREVLYEIAAQTGVPISQIYGVVTFYSQFHLNPRGKNIIRVCQGTACHVRGAKAILTRLEELLSVKPGGTTPDLQFTLETVACIGACGLAPVLMINDDTHGRLTVESVEEILGRYR